MIRRKKDLLWFLDEINEVKESKEKIWILVGVISIVIGVISSLVISFNKR